MKAFYKLVVIVFLWTNFQSTSAQNIFLNSGLDATLDSWNEIISPDNSATIEINNAQSYLGGGCARITLNQLGALGGLAQAATIIPGKHYLLSCAVKTDNLDGIALPYFNLGNTQLELEYGIIPSQQNTDWIVRESRFICPAQVSNITFFLFCQGNSGIAYFDEISLTELPSQPASTFTIDVNTNEGFINPLMHVNAGPLHAQSTIDLTEKFQESHISFVRTHDFYGPCDLHTIFPNFAADENDPLSYDFASSDEMITAIIQSGAKVLFRLGESYELNPIHNNPSTDNDKAATICENIVKHYNDGWNNGFNYDIEHWEIWNEPDLQQFWNGTVEEYISFYSAVANKLRTYDPTLKIGGPAVSSPISGWFIEPFLEAVSTNNLPMDFFSYHFYYMSNPYGFVEADQSMLEKLTQYGLQDAERYITEWNNYTYSPNGGINVWRNDPFNAASTAASLIYLQETNLDAAFRYRADEFYFGMFDDLGEYTYSGEAYKAFSDFTEMPVRLSSTGGDQLGLALLSGRSTDNDSMSVLIANCNSNDSGYTIEFNGIESNELYHYEILRIDSTHMNTSATLGTITASNNTMNISVQAPFTDHILLVRDTINNVSDFSNKKIQFDVYPNPTRSELNIQLSETIDTKVQIVVTNDAGQILSQQPMRSFDHGWKLDTKNLSTGVYHCFIFLDGEIFSRRFVIE